MENWIKVADRLPEPYEIVRISLKGKAVVKGFYGNLSEGFMYENGLRIPKDSIVSWQPFPALPSPPKE